MKPTNESQYIYQDAEEALSHILNQVSDQPATIEDVDAHIGDLWTVQVQETRRCAETGAATTVHRRLHHLEMALANCPAGIAVPNVQSVVRMFANHPPRFRDNCTTCGNCHVQYENVIQNLPRLDH